ncbi:MAG: alpha/beta hydrolase [Alphaproteobacteria bacterium]
MQRPFAYAEALKPDKLLQLYLRSPFGALLASPVIDRPTLWAVTDILFPLSRLWAAAYVARGDVEEFLRQVPMKTASIVVRNRLARTLAGFEAARDEADRAAADWERLFFGTDASDDKKLQAAERIRVDTAQALILQRARFVPLLLGRSIPKVKFAIPTEAEVKSAYGDYLAQPERAFGAPASMPQVEVSRSVPSAAGRDYWLRFASPSVRVGGTVWARVHEPIGVVDPPSFIFGNGIGVEFDQVKYSFEDAVKLCRSGVRVIEIEAPWHGRRIEPGFYPGEPFMARAPLGPIDLFTAQVREIAVLIDWCRRGSRGRIGVGGTSMGALVGQLVATHAKRWPKRLRPDMLGLITFCDRVHELPFTSALAKRAGVGAALAAAGWNAEKCQRWRGFTDALEAPSMEPRNIVAVLGRHDRVTPYEVGRAQVERWGVPPGNVFVRRQGHFSVPLGLVRDDGPLRRIGELLLEQG